MALGFYFDMTHCVGCRACVVACKDKNKLDGSALGLNLRNAITYCSGTFPDVKCFTYSGACNHCESPACLAACAKGAIYKDADGCVIIDAAMCDGCGACVEICPYKAPVMDEVAKVAKKCDACASIRMHGEKPTCVTACPMRCLDFGEMDELKAKYGDGLVCDLAVLPDSAMTKPKVLIKAKEFAKSGEFEEMML